MKRILFALVLFLAPLSVHAQTACPTVVQGQVWTTQQWNACFTSLAAASGGAIVNPTITTPTITGGSINGASVNPSGGIGQIVSVATAAGSVVPGLALDEVVIVNKTTPAATSVILPASSNWPSCPSASSAACPVYVIKDGAGNAATFPIAVTAADGKTIDGTASNAITTNYGAVSFILNGTQWNVLP
jgi:hypothetical protein